MKITLIAQTQVANIPDSVQETKFNLSDKIVGWFICHGADRLAHFAGRACYQSWHMPTEKTQSDRGYISNIINQGHFSVLEHASATFYIEGVSRNLTHELIRHRHLSYSELSQRFVNMEDANFVAPPAVRSNNPGDDGIFPINEFGSYNDTSESFETPALSAYRATVQRVLDRGGSRKQAREAARAYLPSSMETKIVVTGNHRAWRDMLHKRYSVHADAEIQELAAELLKMLRSIAPATYQDFPDQPFN